MKGDGERTLEGWRGGALELKLSAEDLELLDRVLTVAPELRVVAFLGQQARRRALGYPVASVRELADALGDETFELTGHRVSRESVVAAMAPEWFPLAHEGELLSAIHLALHRCRAEAPQAWARAQEA